MSPDDYASMMLTIVGLALLGLGTFAMLVRWIIRVRRTHPDIGRDFIADVKRGEGFTFHRRGSDRTAVNGGPHKFKDNGATAPPRLLTLPQAVRIMNDYPDEVPHTLIVGSTRKGKTTLAHAVIVLRDDAVVILDPKWKPDKWGGVPAVPIDDDGGYTQLEAAIKALLSELTRRLVSLKQGATQFTPLTIVADELQTLVEECESAPQLFKQVGRLGGELKMRLVAIATSDQVKSLGIEGEGDTRDNFTIVRLAEHAYRKAPALRELQLARPAVLEHHGELYALDLSETLSLSQRKIPQSRYYQLPTTEYLLLNLLGENKEVRERRRSRTDVSALWENEPTQAEDFPATETPFPVSESETTFSRPNFSAEEIAQFAALIALGKGKTEVLQSMRGYSGRKHKAYSAVYERIKNAVDEITEQEQVP